MLITSLLDTDYYKFTMMQVVFLRSRRSRAKYRFRCRGAQPNLGIIAALLLKEVSAMGGLALSDDELSYLGCLSDFKPAFVSYLRGFRLNPSQVRISAEASELKVEIEGPWLETILWEVPLLSTINELYFRRTVAAERLSEVHKEGEKRLSAKIDALNLASQAVPFVEFGTRRRFSKAWQSHVVGRLKREVKRGFQGTSNVWLAKELGLSPIGTMGHEYLQAAQVLAPSLEESQTYALRVWLEQYDGKSAIALSDIFGMEAFLADFTSELARGYGGARHDSGDPFRWCEKLIAHYRRLGIDPKTKKAVFSDSLDIEKSMGLVKAFGGDIQVVCAIGTNLTNDLGVEPINIVLKMTELDGSPTAKLSDDPGKSMCQDASYLERLKAMVRDKISGAIGRDQSR